MPRGAKARPSRGQKRFRNKFHFRLYVAGKEVNRRTSVDHTLQHLAQGINIRVPERFFTLLAWHLAAALSADYVLIGERVKSESSKVRTLGFVTRGKIRRNFVYDLTSGPCRRLLQRKQICLYRSGVQKKFPRSNYLKKFHVESFVGIPLMDSRAAFIGAIAMMNRKPLKDPTRAVCLLRIAMARAASEIERRKEQRELKDNQARLATLTRHLVSLQDNERRKITQELHGGISQELALLKLKWQGVRASLRTEKEQKTYDETRTILDGIVQRVQGLSLSLYPPILEDLGLQPAVRWHLKNEAERSGIVAQLRTRPWNKRPKRKIEDTCYRVIQEALNNVARHAHAKEVGVELKRKRTSLEVSIRDDGVGFDVARAFRLVPRTGSVGLLVMQARVKAIGGRLAITAGKGRGTAILVSIPNAFC